MGAPQRSVLPPVSAAMQGAEQQGAEQHDASGERLGAPALPRGGLPLVGTAGELDRVPGQGCAGKSPLLLDGAYKGLRRGSLMTITGKGVTCWPTTEQHSHCYLRVDCRSRTEGIMGHWARAYDQSNRGSLGHMGTCRVGVRWAAPTTTIALEYMQWSGRKTCWATSCTGSHG